jgi:MSHA biogenesis protein MshJ
LFIDPALTRSKALSASMGQQQIELQVLQVKIQELTKRQANPDAVQSARRDDLNRQIAEIDSSVKNLQSGLVPAQRMNALLQDMLTRSPRLQLVSLRTLPVTPLVEKRNATEKPDAGAQPSRTPDKPVAAEQRNVFKHGVQITVQGSYADLYDYLAGLEKLPWHMFWSRASLSGDDSPRLVLTVTIYTLSLDKAWLVV